MVIPTRPADYHGASSAVRSLLKTVATLEPSAYVVGGAIRDLLLKRRSIVDIDIAVPGDGCSLAVELGGKLQRAAVVPLDRVRGTGRIVLTGAKNACVDISRFKGGSLESDLRARDFTMNALAVHVTDFPPKSSGDIVDPMHGIEDLGDGLLRACSDEAFRDDPLRILRGFRFRALFDFRIEDSTRSLMRQSVPGLDAVSPERIRDELFAILDCDRSYIALSEMDEAGIVDRLFPEFRPARGLVQNDYHHLDVWGHSLETVRQMDSITANLRAVFPNHHDIVSEYLDKEPVPGRTGRALLKAAGLGHDIGKPHKITVDDTGRVRFHRHEESSAEIVEEICGRLMLARRETKLIVTWVAGHMRCSVLTSEDLTRRAKMRLIRAFGTDLIGLLILFLADLKASRGPARPVDDDNKAIDAARDLIELLEETSRAAPPPLVTGRDLIRDFGLHEGPIIGEILDGLQELQDRQEVTTREEAYERIPELIAASDVT